MRDYLLLMHNDAKTLAEDWGPYFEMLHASGRFEGGSAIGAGVCVRKDGRVVPIHAEIDGFIRVRAASLEEAKAFLLGNPVYESGGTVEIRELPVSE